MCAKQLGNDALQLSFTPLLFHSTGEAIAIVLASVGARPVKEGTGRTVCFELIPLDELQRPRIDVLASLSGIFRDSFANIVDLLGE